MQLWGTASTYNIEILESFAHDSGCTLVRAEYSYPKGSQVKEKSAATALSTVLASAHTQVT
jgi:hypothetical protein